MLEHPDGSSRHSWELCPFLVIVAAICGLAWLESVLAPPDLPAGETDIAGQPRTAAAIPIGSMSTKSSEASARDTEPTVPVPRPRPATADSVPG